jgi:DnaJ-class molecular chaperone
MPSDHYETLGVSRQATPDEIQKAYRQMARKYHPDLNPNDAKAKEKFQKVQAAFDVLNDPQKRQRYDQFGDAYESFSGGGPQPGPHPWAGAGGPGANPWAGAGGPGAGGFEVNLEDLFGGAAGMGGGGGAGGFADLFKTFKQRNKRAAPTKGSNIEHTLTVPFATAILGGEAQITLQREDGHNESLRVKIPAGIESGKKIRLRGKGEESPSGGTTGDLLIKVEVAPHPHFRRTGNRLDVRVPISLAEAVGGAKIDVPSPYGTITLTIPPGTSSGAKLRVKGQGVKHTNGEVGDLFAEVMVVVPKDLSAEDRAQVLDVLKKYPQNPRAELRW